MAVYERLDVLEKEINDLVKKLKERVTELNAMDEAIANVHALLKGEAIKKRV